MGCGWRSRETAAGDKSGDRRDVPRFSDLRVLKYGERSVCPHVSHVSSVAIVTAIFVAVWFLYGVSLPAPPAAPEGRPVGCDGKRRLM